MKILFYLERAWIVAAVVAILVAAYNFATLQKFNSSVYFPIFCSGFCLLLWNNIRSQRTFREKMEKTFKANEEDAKRIERESV
jgi:hypothetical protein